MTTADAPTRRKRGPIVIAFLTLAMIVAFWTLLVDNRQFQIMGTYLALILGAMMFAAWALVFSGWPVLRRFVPAAVLGALLVGTLSLVEVRGVTGDWIPVWNWRFAGGAAGDIERSGEGAGSSLGRFPAFLGPQGNSRIDDVQLAADWDAEPPVKIWQRDIGAGWAGFAIEGDIAYTLEQREDREVVSAYRLSDGEELWAQGEEAYFSNPIAGPGPRTTPALAESALFALGASGDLWALDKSDGSVLWHRNVVEETKAPIPEHGKSSSPLLVDGLVVVSAGGPEGNSLVAYRQEDGEIAWSSGSDKSSYSSPVRALLGGMDQIVTLNDASISGHGTEDGTLLWQQDYPGSWPNVAPPLVLDRDRVLFSSGYGIGSRVLEIGAPNSSSGTQAATKLWESPRMKAKFTNLVYYDGFVYGLDDGVFVCLDPETGERVWKKGRYGHGNILLVGKHLLVQTEKGDMVLLEATPEGHNELGKFTALRGKAWNPLAFAAPYLLVRNDEEAALWKLPLAG
ncbi:MAG: PQQ-binding-like beta-propeller repeat protein [Acidobacteriota bacterium]